MFCSLRDLLRGRHKLASKQSVERFPMKLFINRFLVFGKQPYTKEAAAIVFEIFRSITLQENTWTTRSKDSTQIYTWWTFTWRLSRLPANAGMWFVGKVLHHELRSLLGQGMPVTWASSRCCLLDGTQLNSVHRKSLFVLYGCFSVKRFVLIFFVVFLLFLLSVVCEV